MPAGYRQNAGSNSSVPQITGVVLTRDGERLISQCLSSLNFCSKILVVDSGSRDATLDLAAASGAAILRRDWTGFADQFTFAHGEVATPWFFILDQDELCSPGLAQAMLRAAANPGGAAAFAVPRRSWYFDRFMRHGGWSPDYVPRLFQRGRVTFSQDAHIHYHPDGPLEKIADLEAVIVHYPYTGFAHQWDKLNAYAEQGAAHMRAKGKKGSLPKAIAHGWMRFIKLYFLKLGLLDGRAGFMAAMHGSFYAFSKYIRLMDASWGYPFNAPDDALPKVSPKVSPKASIDNMPPKAASQPQEDEEKNEPTALQAPAAETLR